MHTACGARFAAFRRRVRRARSRSLRDVDTTFSAELFEWRGPAPFYWLALPEGVCDYVQAEVAGASYGWGAIPVRVRVGGTEWETSLLPRDGGYVLPVKQHVRVQERFGEGDTVTVAMSVAPRGGRAANGTGPTV
jgi:uncharacterized protein DUF1905